ncbi:hypothetical protein CTheo_10 [Ceratobasidium theobromae]|uniref:F-box domain-containing protein n=1 Tax=Ceratobasidium theobromae TaxID=1582974 RepID=A0A5N5QXR7_9AGAM|nr:hypothetical protein CTheo_10 [Ceratobasidium theobromae]
MIDPSCNSPGIFEAKLHNNNQKINKLPAELLSRIFAIGKELETDLGWARRMRSVWRIGIGFQGLVTVKSQSYLIIEFFADVARPSGHIYQGVCGHWRSVAIGSPVLWTHIHIARHPPSRLVTLYISRSGILPLDIDIDIRSQYWRESGIGLNDWANQVTHVPKLLKFLTSIGAGMNRWGSLSVQSNQPESLFEVISILSAEPAPILRSLHLLWRPYSDLMDSIEERSMEYPHLLGDPRPLSSLSLPNLRCMEAVLVPLHFVLDRPLPLLTGLTSLEITAATRLPSVRGLQQLLSANPQLQYLYLNSTFGSYYISEHPSPPAQLLNLHHLSIESGVYTSWAQDVLLMIEAPCLNKFALSTLTPNNEMVDILKYISTGALPRANKSRTYIDTRVPNKPIYPALCELDVSGLAGLNSVVADMCSSFSLVTHLSIASSQGEILTRVPWVLPDLEFVTAKDYHFNSDLENIVHRRRSAGLPIQAIKPPIRTSFPPRN